MRNLLALVLAFAACASAAAAPQYWGDRPDGSTLYFYTTTVDTSGNLATIASEAVVAYKDNSDTELTTGVAIDDDIDSKTGLHRVSVDCTQTGFTTGSLYTVVYSAGTCDGVALTGRIIGSFYLGDNPQTGDAYAVVASGSSGNAALKTLIDTLDDFVDTEVAAIKAVTDALTSAAATKLATNMGIVFTGTVDSDTEFTATATEFESDDVTTAAADFWNGRTLIFTSGALTGQMRKIMDYSKVGSNGHFTVPTLTSAPANNVTFIIL